MEVREGDVWEDRSGLRIVVRVHQVWDDKTVVTWKRPDSSKTRETFLPHFLRAAKRRVREDRS